MRRDPHTGAWKTTKKKRWPNLGASMASRIYSTFSAFLDARKCPTAQVALSVPSTFRNAWASQHAPTTRTTSQKTKIMKQDAVSGCISNVYQITIRSIETEMHGQWILITSIPWPRLFALIRKTNIWSLLEKPFHMKDHSRFGRRGDYSLLFYVSKLTPSVSQVNVKLNVQLLWLIMQRGASTNSSRTTSPVRNFATWLTTNEDVSFEPFSVHSG